jgi:hypothetical protein
MRMMMTMMTALVACGASAATAQQSTYFAERGHWMVYNGSTACRALNRPGLEFNAAPFNALQIVVRSGNRIGVEVFFWPGAIDPAIDNALALGFGGSEPFLVPATATMGDYMLASDDSPELWGRLQKAKAMTAKPKNDPTTTLFFALDEIGWVLGALDACSRVLPKE